MNDELVIRVEGLNKSFKLYKNPRHRLVEAIHPFRKKFHKNYNALRDVNFEIKKGESIGILGRNGAGKSTLLKILTKVQAPTSGKIYVKGRIAALLELGSGFNPALSGIENIYFQGAILGFKKTEMDKKIKEIIDFSEIGEYINQPVKTYSSGMFARLAFSISINVDPDILIVDEALSVGDIGFQLKCFEKLEKMKRDKSITLLFVSHDINSLKSICTRGFVIEDGYLHSYNEIKDACRRYELSLMQFQAGNNNVDQRVPDISIIEMKMINQNASSHGVFDFDDQLELKIKVRSKINLDKVIIAFYIRNKYGQEILGTNTDYSGAPLKNIKENEEICVSFKFQNCLKEGEYTVSALISESISKNFYYDWKSDFLKFQVLSENLKPKWSLVTIPYEVITERSC